LKPKTFMFIAGESSGDMLAAELARALREEAGDGELESTNDCQPLSTSLEPRFFGAGGPRMAQAGVELAIDMSSHAVTGLSDVARNLLKFRRIFLQLRTLARQRMPDAIICVDFSGFNLRFAESIRKCQGREEDWFFNWRPRIIQYVSPQVWASREGRVERMAQVYDLVLSIFPFEKDWYAKRMPQLRVEFVGHPMLDRYAAISAGNTPSATPQSVLLLPGSRNGELDRHLPPMIGALDLMRKSLPGLAARMVLPDETLAAKARVAIGSRSIELQCGGLPKALRLSTIAMASTGTVTMECAFFSVPTVALYKTSWSTYQIGKRLIQVKYLAMPNLLAGEEIFPEFIQQAAPPQNLANAALALLRDEARRNHIKTRLDEIIKSLGEPGASRRAAKAIAALVLP
jgi:lipid-A-disaccharide synthase